MSLAYETSEETVSPFRYIIIYQRQRLLSNDILVDPEGVEPSSSDYKSDALSVVLRV